MSISLRSPPNLLCSALITLLIASSLTVASGDSVLNLNKDGFARRMVAAQPDFPVKERDIGNRLRYDHELHYLEEQPKGTSPPAAAQLQLSTKKPSLALETLENQISSIYCSDDKLHLTFATAAALTSVSEQLEKSSEFLVITSHEACNMAGERAIYLVTDVIVDSLALSVKLSIAPISWHEACHSTRVSFGRNTQDLSFRRHGGLHKRQGTFPTAVSTVSFSVPPSSSPTPTAVHQVHQDIDIDFQDTQILPPKFPGSDNAKLHAPFVPHGITFGCANCTATGSIDLIEGEFSIGSNNSDDNLFSRRDILNTTEEIFDFFRSGYLEFQLNALAAHFEFDSQITRSEQLATFKIPFPSIPITPFQIPGVAAVGPIFNPNLVISFQVDSDMNFTYGFDLSIPPSTITLDVANITNSSITGFTGATINALPFQSSFNSIGLTLSAAFSPELLLGISVFEGQGTAGAGAYLTLPSVSATVSEVSHVDSNCEPAPPSTPADATNATADLFASLTHLSASANMSVGVIAEAALNLGSVNLGDQKPFPLFETGYPLPTACLSFDQNAKTFAPASAVVASATAAAAGISLPGGKKSAASVGRVNPVSELGRVRVTAVGLLAVLGYFVSL